MTATTMFLKPYWRSSVVRQYSKTDDSVLSNILEKVHNLKQVKPNSRWVMYTMWCTLRFSGVVVEVVVDLK